MNIRVLELLRNPKIITESDLKILESEAEKMPYAQSIRALYLYGINRYHPENYKENLYVTAAYTTDKKILYQFINSEQKAAKEIKSSHQKLEQGDENQIINEQTTAENIIERVETQSKTVEDASVVLNKFDISKIIATEEAEAKPEFIVVDGQKNRLLYEGEENFLQEKLAEIDVETTKELGVITIKDDLENQENLIAPDDNSSEETIVENNEAENISEAAENPMSEVETKKQVPEEDSSADISFASIDDFLPQVKFSVPKNHSDHLNPPKQESKKSEIADKEKPTSTSQNRAPKVTETSDNEDEKNKITFENTQTFEISKSEKAVANDLLSVSEQPSTWRPMSFSNNTPDALIDQSTEKEKSIPNSKTEIPISQKEQKKEIPTIGEKTNQKEESNVGSFINTWQNWLKIERQKPAEPAEKTTVAKEKIIDQFIEKNPKISQLKDEVNFVVKEKKDDISHLMTETLAKLYVEQKLYSKAIKAYEALSEKHPEKADYYQQKILEVKEIRKS
ncbi:hypothetical protein [Chryseobacterium sp. SC28]|uniref:hypothetical protein n=1 Tax=Chryseobacterium sp. SC28 TaxID=2268028 RepID=UPI000F65059B|nr:hypothetical protein [Chryseobacterium sp. SC28]RRQ47137.1 hypothetical protein DTW91_00140 [Chryseobacterium sp. SC28]